jgi:hypothetical protein
MRSLYGLTSESGIGWIQQPPCYFTENSPGPVRRTPISHFETLRVSVALIASASPCYDCELEWLMRSSPLEPAMATSSESFALNSFGPNLYCTSREPFSADSCLG